ncbi:TonB-dependent siderophore receptor [Nostoc sp. LPT]|uniref:TonB-dependent siderophore receptor n=1 Tax=Nostoc sp. LPT TaxID=2815387 RepID=UPI0025E5A2DF|nr:TonB-dependent siderophore receptor [Nostoc sp. LPT]
MPDYLRIDKDWQNQKIRQLSELEIPITSAQKLLVQSNTPQTTPVPTIPITGVRANPTDKGVEVILETLQGTQLQVTNRSAGNNFIVDITGGQLRLPSGDAFTFRSEKPLAEITEITATNIDANTVRVTVVGEKALPTVELFDDNTGLVFGITSATTATSPPPQPETPQAEPSAEADEPIELVVTGEQDSYRVPNASTATRTDTPLRDIPQSIQVVPRQVLENRNVRTVSEAVETVSGVVNNIKFYGPNTTNLIIRGVGGFGQAGTFRNGFRDVNLYGLTGVETIEQVEILKGPASVLFGAFEPGGIVNIVTKQPLSDPYYRLAFEAGNYGFYRPIIDLSGPLDANKNVLYRFIASYQDSNSIRDFVSENLIEIAPSITLKLGNRTNLNLYYEYLDYSADPYDSLDVLLSDGRKLPRSRYLGYPDEVYRHTTTQKFGYTLNHKFSDNWQIRNNLSVSLSRTKEQNVSPSNLVDDRSLELVAGKREFSGDVYSGTIDLLGKFNTGSISHQVLVGFDISRREDTFGFVESNLPNLDIFNPNYNIPKPEFAEFAVPPYQNTQSYGIYLQDQIALLNNLKLLIGGRFDWVSQEYLFTETPILNDSAFSPRIGLVYQPSQSISLYTSYSQSFNPSNAFSRNPDGRFFEPTKGAQYEAGIKADFLDRKLSTTLVTYQITKSNIITRDPNDPGGFSIQVGEQQSRGIELDIAGEILQGLKVVASYAYTDAEVTKDRAFAVGNKLIGVPENQASLWTTYEIQQGNLKGLGFGLGLFYVGTVAGDLDNTFTLEDYLRTDAALYYKRDGLKAAINIRNLFDTDYFSGSDGGRIYIQRGAPLTITGSISWEF